MFRRRRRVALALIGAAALLGIWGLSSLLDSGSGREGRLAELPRGGRVVLPRHEVVALYGAPQDPELGALGIGTPAEAGGRLLKLARSYHRPGRPVLPAFELIAVVARQAPGPDGQHRMRQSAAVIRRYLDAARKIKALLILDIQPGQADFLDEAKLLEPYLKQPDVGLALDPEWSLAPGQAPGLEIGSTDAAIINSVSGYLSDLVWRNNLPQKVLLVHQFTEGMVTNDAAIVSRPGIAIVSNVDGFGSPDLKAGVYRQLARTSETRPQSAGFYNGLKLFFREDSELMSPAGVFSLQPRPDVVVYE